MKLRPGAPLLLLAPLVLAGCPRQGDYAPPPQPGYAPPGQWAPPPPTAPAPPPPAFPTPWWQPPPIATLPFPGWGLPPVPAPPFVADPGQRCVNVVNEHRATQRLPPLSRWWPTESCASSQARDGASTGQAHGAFGRCQELGQNVCPAWAGPADRMIAPCIQSMWAEGPGGDFATHGHYINLSSQRFSKVACGFFTAPTGQVWAVLDFQ